MTKLGEALREKYDDPKKVLALLGLDESLLSGDTKSTEKTTMSNPTRFANLALQLTSAAVKPFLAKDAKINLMPIFKDVTTKNFKAKTVKLALDAALKGKLAKDAEPQMGHVAQILDYLEEGSGATADESVSQAQHDAMGAAAGGKSNLDIPKDVGAEFMHADKGKGFDANMENLKGFLKEKGMGEDDIMKACDMAMPKNALDEKDPDEKEVEAAEKTGEKDAKELEDKTAKDAEAEKEEEARAKGAEDKRQAHDAALKNMVTKQAMDAAIDQAVKATEKRVVETQRAISKAKDAVQPYVGSLSSSLALDSADDVYRTALTMRNVDVKGIHPSAFPKILSMLPKSGAREVEQETKLAMDHDAVDKINKKYPGIAAIGTA